MRQIACQTNYNFFSSDFDDDIINWMTQSGYHSNFNHYKDFVTYYSLIKFFVSAVVLTFIIWIFKNFKTNAHHKILNRDRLLAIKSFQHLMEAAGSDIELKKIILGQVSNTLLEHRNTGYINTKQSKTNSVLQNMLASIINAIKK